MTQEEKELFANLITQSTAAILNAQFAFEHSGFNEFKKFEKYNEDYKYSLSNMLDIYNKIIHKDE